MELRISAAGNDRYLHFRQELQQDVCHIVRERPFRRRQGSVEIEYDRTGNWEFGDVSLDTWGGPRDENYRSIQKNTPAPGYMATIVLERLHQGKWSREVCEAVREQLASDREDAMEARADARRDDRMGV